MIRTASRQVRRDLVWAGLAVVIALVIGATVGINPLVGAAVFLILLGALSLSLPASVWAVAALVAALAARMIVTLTPVPELGAFLDIPLAWGALAAAIFRKSQFSPRARTVLRFVIALILSMVASSLFHSTEFFRLALYLGLLGQPFAIIAALLIDPPTQSQRRLLIGTAFALLLIQLPVGAWQLATFGSGDPIEGTQFGAGGGTRPMAGVMVLGGFWLLAKRERASLWTSLLALSFFAWPFFANVRQVILLVPLAFVVGTWGRPRRAFTSLVLGIAVVGSVLLVFLPEVYRSDSFRILNVGTSAEGGKALAVKVLRRELTTDPASFLFGKGPAQTVGRTAFLTIQAVERFDPAIRSLGLQPARIAREVQEDVRTTTGRHPSSFSAGTSSLLGVLGDLGMVGIAIYLAAMVWILRAVMRERSAEASVAASGWAMAFVLGFAFEWLENPAFMVFLGVITGLALSSTRGLSRPRRVAERAP